VRSVPDGPDTDPQLLAAARRAFAARQFRLSESTLPAAGDSPWLLAENDHFVVAVVAARSLEDLRVLEGQVAVALGDLLAATDLGPKRWDAYVVLLARSDAEQRGRPDVLDLEYNTRSLRRIVSLGVSETSVDEALAPFFALPQPPPGGLPSAYEELVEQLIVHGIERERAEAAVAMYRRSGSVSDS